MDALTRRTGIVRLLTCALGGWLLAVTAGCTTGGTGGGGDGGPVAGEAGGACLAGGTCNEGLACDAESNTCQEVGVGGGGGGDDCVPTVWQETSKLVAADAAAGDGFGYSVGVDGDTAIVGSGGGDDACPSDPYCDSGSAYIFTRSSGGWSRQAKLTASDAAAGDLFGGWYHGDGHSGGSVAVDGDTAIVGAEADDDACPSDPDCDSGSAYIFVRSGGEWIEQAKVTASDREEDAAFGAVVALDGDTALVGARFHAERDEFVHGELTQAGAAYVFVRSGEEWTEQAKLIPSDRAADTNFGSSVALDGDTALIGAWRDDVVGGDSGSVYVFVRSGDEWSEQVKLTSSDLLGNARFGVSVAIDGDTAVVGAHGQDNGIFEGHGQGAAYIFSRTASVWTEQVKLVNPSVIQSYFGFAVAVDGGTVVVGANSDLLELGASGSGPTPSDDMIFPGSAYVFARSDGVWNEQEKLTASDAANHDFFGDSVDVSGDTVVVGVHEDDDNCPESDEDCNTGAAYVFEFDPIECE